MAPLYRDAPEAASAKAAGKEAFADFIEELLPHASAGERHLHADVIERTLSCVGASFSETPRSPQEMDAYADALADMLCGHLERLNPLGAI